MSITRKQYDTLLTLVLTHKKVKKLLWQIARGRQSFVVVGEDNQQINSAKHALKGEDLQKILIELSRLAGRGKEVEDEIKLWGEELGIDPGRYA